MQTKKTPLRMCIVCKTMHPKKELIRIVLNKDGDLNLDTTGKLAGRGAYICSNESCILTCIKSKALNRTFKMQIETEMYDKLLEQYTTSKQGE